MKTKIVFSLLLMGIVAFYFIACNSDENSSAITENQTSASKEISGTEVKQNIEKLAFGQTLLLDAKKNNVSVYHAVFEELRKNCEGFDMFDITTEKRNAYILERVEILEKYFPTLANHKNSNTTYSEDYTVLCMCLICGYIYDEREGDPDNGIPPGTPFSELPDDWKCPCCKWGKGAFWCL
jgi:rubredoxin